MSNFLNLPTIDTANPDYAEIFKNMQGNILKGHGRDHATMIFIRFKERAEVSIEDVKDMLADFTEEHVTSFYKQLWERERYKRNKVPGNTFGNIFFTKKGCDYLEMKENGEKKLNDQAFIEGMKERRELNDLEKFYEEWNKKEIHTMLLLADDNKNRMDIQAGQILDDMKKKNIIEYVHIEYGDAIRNSNGDGLEHNGYVDGISQPLFIEDEVEDYKKRHNIKGDDFKFDPRKTPGLVLFNDPFAEPSDSYGSYFVFRKLEQNVKAFKVEEEEIGEALYGETEEAERAGAMLVGRFEDGTPKQVQQEDKLIASGAFNNFNYDVEADPSNGRCPHFAHIRKTNPRIDTRPALNDPTRSVNIFDDSTMARRGIPYGHRNVSTELDDIQTEQFPEGGVGLLFMSYQESIVKQFEVIQQRANNKINGVDPVIGQTENENERSEYVFPEDGDTLINATLNHTFNPHITFRGGEYFFAPSITFLRTLKRTETTKKTKLNTYTNSEIQIHKSR